MMKLKPGRKLTHGYGRVEDLAGAVVLLLIFASAVVAAYTSVERLISPRDIEFPWVLLAACIVGFVGNEAVALLRMRVGKKINSAALVADGYHARVDGFTSLAVVGAAIGALAGFPILDPIIGLLISALILKLLVTAAGPVITHLLDGVEPGTVSKIESVVAHVPGDLGTHDVKARWSGHEINIELAIAVPSRITVTDGHAIAAVAEHELRAEFPAAGRVVVHVDPESAPDLSYHHEAAHSWEQQPVQAGEALHRSVVSARVQ
jgi:cation diffusion facilitator family transporter